MPIEQAALRQRFAQELKTLNSPLAESVTRLRDQFTSLVEMWRDQEQQKIAREFEQTVRVLQQFNRSVKQRIPFLRKIGSIGWVAELAAPTQCVAHNR
jgi:hypothetical protein